MDLIYLLEDSPLLFIPVVGLFGLMIGSFLNVVILRLPVMMEREWQAHCAEYIPEPGSGTHLGPGSSNGVTGVRPVGSDPGSSVGASSERFNLITPRSRCPACGHPIGAVENIPLLSWLLLRGRCSTCGTQISARYPLVESLTMVLSILVAWHFGVSWETLAVLALTWALIALSVIDIDHQLLPDNITLPFLWLGLLLNLSGMFTDLGSAVIGAAAGYLSLWSIYWLFKLLTGKEGMGHGDFKLLALFGAWLGWQYLLPVVLISSLVGAAIGIGMILLLGRDRNIPIPFGPYLAIAGWITILWGPGIVEGYWWWMGV